VKLTMTDWNPQTISTMPQMGRRIVLVGSSVPNPTLPQFRTARTKATVPVTMLSKPKASPCSRVTR